MYVYECIILGTKIQGNTSGEKGANGKRVYVQLPVLNPLLGTLSESDTDKNNTQLPKSYTLNNPLYGTFP